jgi:FAD:protein FMN transferase
MKSSKTPKASWHFEALGTAWEVATQESLGHDIRKRVTECIKRYDATYSRFRHDSLASQLREPGIYKFPADVTELFELYSELYNLTSGRMTPLIGGALEDAGYDAEYSLQTKKIRAVPALSALGWDSKVTMRPTEPVVLDVGAAGKGQLVDEVASLLEQDGCYDYTVDASGDIRTRGNVQIIGLEHPLKSKVVIGVANVHNKSLCASAVNRRTWANMHHVFDPLSKQPTDTVLATWVLATTTLLADALATALFFVPPKTLLQKYEFSYVIMNKHGVIDVAPDFNGELFI